MLGAIGVHQGLNRTDMHTRGSRYLDIKVFVDRGHRIAGSLALIKTTYIVDISLPLTSHDYLRYRWHDLPEWEERFRKGVFRPRQLQRSGCHWRTPPSVGYNCDRATNL